MKIIISPSKTQDDTVPVRTGSTQPLFVTQVHQLVSHLKKIKQNQLASLMKMSDKLAAVNYERFQNFQPIFTQENSRQALFMFQGDQFNPMQTETYTQAQLLHSQHHVRILSGLYGMLRPLDLMQPYRLEMATKIPVGSAGNLYGFWGEHITRALNNEFREDSSPVLINMASVEYCKVIKKNELKAKILKVAFKQEKAGKIKTIAIYAKRARGAMVDFVLRNMLTEPEELQSFSVDGYSFMPDLSTGDTEWVFVKKL
jgi:cytoplasmic iron level regulating protein YaaA (DUF328/UPF0246 family)